MSTEINSSSRPLTFWDALQLLFIGLKLANVIDWPWWQVFLPFIITLVILVIVEIAHYYEW